MELTQEQTVVANNHDENMLVIAAAGSGKTRVITQRFVNLIKKGVDTSRILCITFTNKAGNEMRERVAEAANLKPSELSIFTFHGFCNYWLRSKCSEIGMKPYNIIDADVASNVIKSQCDKYIAFERDYKSYIMMKHGNADDLLHDYLVRENKIKKKYKTSICNKVKSYMANNLEDDISVAVKRCNLDSFETFITKVIKGYTAFKRAHNYLDFDDLQSKGVKLFKEYQMSQHYDYIMVDEIQDSSVVDLTLLTTLGINNTMAVGD